MIQTHAEVEILASAAAKEGNAFALAPEAVLALSVELLFELITHTAYRQEVEMKTRLWVRYT